MEATRERVGFRSALAHRDFRYLLGSLAVSETGDWLYAAALVVYILDATGSVAWVGIAGAIRLLPSVFFEPLGGAIADRADRRRLMIGCDLLRAGLMLVLGLVALSTSTGAVVAAIAIAFTNNAVGTPYYPAVTSLTPSVVGERDLAAANALSGTIDNLALAFGPALSAVVLVLSGSPPLAFAINAVTFLVSAWLVARIRTTGRVEEAEEEEGLLGRLAAGGRAIRSAPEAIVLIGLVAAFGLTLGQETVLFGAIADDLLGIGTEASGFLFAAPGVGGILAAGAAGRLAARPRTTGVLAVAVLISGVPLTVLAFVHEPVVAIVFLTIEGAAIIVADVVSTTMLQRLVPERNLGSVFGILGAVTVGAMTIGSLAAPVTIGLLGLEQATFAAGALLLVVSFAVLPRAREMDRRQAARADELAPIVRILEAADIMEGATPQALEGLAAVASLEMVEAGTRVIVQGDEPDDLFVVVHGEVEVTSARDGVEVVLGTVGSGEVVGEIGLLEHRPRTATVTATARTELLRIPGGEFLRVVNEGPRLSPTFLAAITNRLAAHDPAGDRNGD